jgi:molybdopterin molybdotransferase
MAELMHPVPDKLLPFSEARRLLFESIGVSLRSETVPLAQAHARALATDIRAPIDVPAFDRSAMDGYAIRASDSKGIAAGQPRAFKLVGAAHAGAPFEGKLRGGDCVQIATGAPVPGGCDAVVMVERTKRVGDQVWLDAALKEGENVSVQGSDVKKGTVAVAHDSVLTPARLAVLASLGVTKVNVYHRPKVALLSTGSELREPGEELERGTIYDSNTTSLTNLLEAHGVIVEKSGILPDDPKVLRTALTRFRGFDLILVTGSSSAGEHDYLAETVRNLGSIQYHGVGVKPGKPLLLAKLWAKPLLGLAGNPASCVMMAYALVVPALRRFQHLPLDWERRVRAKLLHRVTSPPGKRHFLPVRVKPNGGCESVYKESDATTSIANADGYIEIPDETTHLDEGAIVIVHLF